MTRTPDDRTTEYALTRSQATTLAGATGLPVETREEIFAHYAKVHGAPALASLFAQFMGLANSVVANNRTALEIFGMVNLDGGPYTVEKYNLPTIFGACNGAIIADGVEQEGLCGGCAFRIGTHANQSPVTTCDADYCSHPGEQPFMCHEDMREDGDPKRACVGFARLRATRKLHEVSSRPDPFHAYGERGDLAILWFAGPHPMQRPTDKSAHDDNHRRERV